MAELLDIVNEKDEVIGQIERDDSRGIKHIFRTVFIGFYTSDKHMILQLRSMAKIYNPGKLTSTVSGHVESGHSYDDTAIKEGFEETGIVIDPSKLMRVGVTYDGEAMRAVYAYPFDGKAKDLKIEKDEGAGFITMTISDLRKELTEHPEKFTPFMHSKAGIGLINYIDGVQSF
jgi:isopentenyl-diphosphate Delta-isomerase